MSAAIHSRDHLRATLNRHFSILDIVDAIAANDDLVILKNDKPDFPIITETPAAPVHLDVPENPFSLPLRDYDLNPYIHPTMASSGYAGHLSDADGNDYVDFMSAWGTNLLGYGYPAVANAVTSQIQRFAGLGMPFPQFF